MNINSAKRINGHTRETPLTQKEVSEALRKIRIKRAKSEFKPGREYIAQAVARYEREGGTITKQSAPATTDKERSQGVRDTNPAYDLKTKFGQVWGNKRW
jgi:hypothetical protein